MLTGSTWNFVYQPRKSLYKFLHRSFTNLISSLVSCQKRRKKKDRKMQSLFPLFTHLPHLASSCSHTASRLGIERPAPASRTAAGFPPTRPCLGSSPARGSPRRWWRQASAPRARLGPRTWLPTTLRARGTVFWNRQEGLVGGWGENVSTEDGSGVCVCVIGL